MERNYCARSGLAELGHNTVRYNGEFVRLDEAPIEAIAAYAFAQRFPELFERGGSYDSNWYWRPFKFTKT